MEGSTTSGLGGRLHIVWLLNEELTAGAAVNQLISTKWWKLNLSTDLTPEKGEDQAGLWVKQVKQRRLMTFTQQEPQCIDATSTVLYSVKFFCLYVKCLLSFTFSARLEPISDLKQAKQLRVAEEAVTTC